MGKNKNMSDEKEVKPINLEKAGETSVEVPETTKKELETLDKGVKERKPEVEEGIRIIKEQANMHERDLENHGANQPETEEYKKGMKKVNEKAVAVKKEYEEGIDALQDKNPEIRKEILKRREAVKEKMYHLIRKKGHEEEIANLNGEITKLTLLYEKLDKEDREKYEKGADKAKINEAGKAAEEKHKKELAEDQNNKAKIILENAIKDLKDIKESDFALIKKIKMIDSLISKIEEMDEIVDISSTNEKFELLKKERSNVGNLLNEAKAEIEKDSKLKEEILEQITNVDKKIENAISKKATEKIELYEKEKIKLVLRFNELEKNRFN